ncbi:MAG: PspC domain-containing protein [Clostridiales Family XIII bacterium]|jgi:phage shock protein PspC (stress-responsive transcriptional regulator)|nr:PspC domain-containing protein [Clostridiales Family XIII bacterium]
MHKRLYKSSADRILFGVCGGIAEYFDVDPVIIRLLMTAFALTGAGILFYILAAIIMRERPEDTLNRRRPAAGPSYSAGGAETYSDEFADAGTGAAGDAEPPYATDSRRPRASGRKGSGIVIFGLILIIFGVFYLIDRFVPIFYWIDFRAIVAVILVLLGIYFVAKH